MIKPLFRTVMIGAASLALPGCVTTATQDLSAIPTAAYRLDPAHARLNWSIDHRGLSRYTARFDMLEGSLDFDPNAPEQSQLFIKIDPASVSTGDPDFDQTIATDSAYFNAGSFPEITFKSTQIQTTGPNTGTVTGDLTFLGETRPVMLSVEFLGVADSFRKPGQTIGFDATGTFNRSDFGLTHLLNFGIGDQITLDISAEFNEVVE